MHPDTHLVISGRVWPAKDNRDESVTLHVAALNEYEHDTANAFEAPRTVTSKDPAVIDACRRQQFPCYARLTTRSRTVAATDKYPARVFENVRTISDVETLDQHHRPQNSAVKAVA